METKILKWFEFRKKQLQTIKEGYIKQMEPLAEEIKRIDYEIFLLDDAITEARFQQI